MADSNGIEDISDEEDEENDLDEFEVIDELDDEDEIKYEIDDKIKLSTIPASSSKQSVPESNLTTGSALAICKQSSRNASTKIVTKPAIATAVKSTTMTITKSTTTAAKSASATVMTVATATEVTSYSATSTMATNKCRATSVKATAISVSKPAETSTKSSLRAVPKPTAPLPKSATIHVSKPTITSMKSTTTFVSKPTVTPVKSTSTPVSKHTVTPVSSTATSVFKPTVVSAKSATTPVSKSTIIPVKSAATSGSKTTITRTTGKSTTASVIKPISTPAKANTTSITKPIITPTKSTLTMSTKSTVAPTTPTTSNSTTSKTAKSSATSITQPTVTYTNSTTPAIITETPATSTTASAIVTPTTVITKPRVSVAKSTTVQPVNKPIVSSTGTESIVPPAASSTAKSKAPALSAATKTILTLARSAVRPGTKVKVTQAKTKKTIAEPTSSHSSTGKVTTADVVTNTSESIAPDTPDIIKKEPLATSTPLLSENVAELIELQTVADEERSMSPISEGAAEPQTVAVEDRSISPISEGAGELQTVAAEERSMSPISEGAAEPQTVAAEDRSMSPVSEGAAEPQTVAAEDRSMSPVSEGAAELQAAAAEEPIISHVSEGAADPKTFPTDERSMSPISEGAASSLPDEGGLSPISDEGRFSPVSDKEGSIINFSDDEGNLSPVSDKPGGFSPISDHGETEFDERSLSPVSDKSASSTHSEKQQALSPVSDKSLKREWSPVPGVPVKVDPTVDDKSLMKELSPVPVKVKSPVGTPPAKESTPENQLKTTNEDNFMLETKPDDGTSAWKSTIYEHYNKTLFIHPVKPIDLIHAHLRPMITQCESIIARFTGASGSDKKGHVQLRFPSAEVTDDIYKKMSAKKLWKPDMVISRPGQITSFSVGTWLLDDGNEVSLPSEDAGSKTLVYVSNISADATKQMFRALFPRATNIDIVKNDDNSNTGTTMICLPAASCDIKKTSVDQINVARLEFLTRQIAETSVTNVEKHEMNGKRLSMHIISSKSQTEGGSRSSSIVNNDRSSTTRVSPTDVRNSDRSSTTRVSPTDVRNIGRPSSSHITHTDGRNTIKEVEKHNPIDSFGRSRELRLDPTKRTADDDVIVIDDEEDAAKKAKLHAICGQFSTSSRGQNIAHQKSAASLGHGQTPSQRYQQPSPSGEKRPFPGINRNDRPVAKFRRAGSPARELNQTKMRSINQLAANKALTLAKSMALKQRLQSLQQKQQQQQQQQRQPQQHQQALPSGVMMSVPSHVGGPPTIYLRPRAPLFPAAASLSQPPPVLNPNLLRYLNPQLQQPMPVVAQNVMPPVAPVDPMLGTSDQGVWSNLAPGDLQQVQQRLYPGQVLMPPHVMGDSNMNTRFSVPHKAPSLDRSNPYKQQQQQQLGLTGNQAMLNIDASNDQSTHQKRTVSEIDLAHSFVDKWSIDHQDRKKSENMMESDVWHNNPQPRHHPQHHPPHNPLHSPPNVQHPPPHDVQHSPPHLQPASAANAPLRWMSGRPEDSTPSNLSRTQTFEYGHGHQLRLQPQSKVSEHVPNPPRSQFHPRLLQSVTRPARSSDQLI